MLQKVTHTGGVVVRKTERGELEVLLIKRDHGQEKYFLPGGRIEENESEIATSRREVKEETDVDQLTLVADLGVVQRNGVNDQGRRYLKTIRYFLYLSSDARTSGWESLGATDKKFWCFWRPLTSFPQEVQFSQEAGLSATALTFL